MARNPMSTLRVLSETYTSQNLKLVTNSYYSTEDITDKFAGKKCPK
jgi:hypothetical protein